MEIKSKKSAGYVAKIWSNLAEIMEFWSLNVAR